MAVGIPVGDVMRKAVVTAKKKDSVDKITKVMSHSGIGSIIICEKGKVAGIITEGDIVKMIAKGKNPKTTKAGSIMTRPVKVILKKTDIESAAQIMRDFKIARLPIVDKGKLCGIITERDLVKMEPALLELMVEKGNLEAVAPAHQGIDISGYCENCRNYSDDLRYVEFRYLCEDCRRL